MANGFLEGVADVATGVQQGGRRAANDFLVGLNTKISQNNQKFQQRFNVARANALEREGLSKQAKSITDPVARSNFYTQQEGREDLSQNSKDFIASLRTVDENNQAKFAAGISSVQKLIGAKNPSGARVELDALDAENGETPTSIRIRGGIENEADQTIIEGIDILNDVKTKLNDKDNLTSEEVQNLMGILESTAGEMSRASFEASDRGKEVLAEFQEAGQGVDPFGGLTGEVKNRAIAAERARQGDPRAQEAVAATDKQKEIRSRFAGLGAKEESSATLANIFDEVTPLINNIFTSETFGERVIDGVRNIYSLVTQEGSKAVDLAQYDTVVQGVVGQVRKLIGGEKGVMTEKDADRIIGLFPRIRGTVDLLPDNRKVAQRKLKFLQGSLDREMRSILKEKGFSEEEIEAKFQAEEAQAPQQGAEDFSGLTEEELDVAIAAEQGK